MGGRSLQFLSASMPDNCYHYTAYQLALLQEAA